MPPPNEKPKSLSDLKKIKDPPSNNQLLDLFKRLPSSTIRQLNYPQNQTERVRLAKLISLRLNDNDIKKALYTIKDQLPNFRLKSLTLSRKTQPDLPFQRQVEPEEKPTIPEFTPEIEPDKEKGNDINEENKQPLENWLNNFKSYLEIKKRQAYLGSKNFSEDMWHMLEVYRKRLFPHLLSQNAQNLLANALGPFGNMMSLIANEKLSFEVAWSKNLINPNSIYYYSQTLPSQQAFKIIKYGAKGAFAILAKGGAPLISKVHFNQDIFDPFNPLNKDGFITKTITKHVFAPALYLNQANNAAADFLDKISDAPASFEKHIEKQNKELNNVLKNYQKAKKSKNKVNIKKTRKEIKKLLHKHDGSGFFKGIFKKRLSRASSRFRRATEDPSMLLSLLVGTIWDMAVGAIIDIVAFSLKRVIGLLPGANYIRATINKFITSSRWLNTARIGGTTIHQFVKGVFSPTTVSGTYLGAILGKPLAQLIGGISGNAALGQALILPAQITLGAITGISGAIYQTALNLANLHPTRNPFTWTQEIQHLESIIKSPHLSPEWKIPAQIKLDQMSVKGLRPGPITRLSSFLHKRWWARLPLNGLAIGHLLSPFLQQYYGWSTITSMAVFAGTEYLWLIRKGLSRVLFQNLKWTIGWGPNATEITSFRGLYQKFYNWISPKVFDFYWQNIAHYFDPATKQFIKRGWYKIAKNIGNFIQNALPQIKPYLKTFFNPGFLAGFTLIGPLIAAGMNPFLAIVLGPVAGSSAFLLVSKLATSINPSIGMVQFNAISWATTTIGITLQLLGGFLGWTFTSAWWWMPLWSFGIPFALTIAIIPGLTALGTWLAGSMTAWISGFGTSILVGINAIGVISSLPIVAAIGGIALISGIAIFAGFVILSAFWVPFSDLSSQSQCLGIQNTVSQTFVNPGDTVEFCTDINITSDPFLTNEKWFEINTGIVNHPNIQTWDNFKVTTVKRTLPSSFNPFPNIEKVKELTPASAQSEIDQNTYFIKYDFPLTGGNTSVTKLFIGILGKEHIIENSLHNQVTFFELASSIFSTKQYVFTLIGYLEKIKQHVQFKLNINDELSTQIEIFNEQIKVLEEIQEHISPDDSNLTAALELTINNYESNPFSTTIEEIEISTACDPNYYPPPENYGGYDSNDCKNHQQNLISIYESYPNVFRTIKQDLEKMSESNTVFNSKKESFLSNIENLIKTLQESEKSTEELKNNIDSVSIEDTINIIPENIPDETSNFSQEFKDFLTNTFSILNKKFYFLPERTKIHACWKATYVGQEGKPINVNISAAPNTTILGNFITIDYCAAGSSINFNLGTIKWPYDHTPEFSTKVGCYSQNFFYEDCSPPTVRYIHRGIDLNGTQNYKIYPTSPGTVYKVDNISSDSVFGTHVIIYHGQDSNGDQWYSIYAHLAVGSILVNEEDEISTSDQIGTQNATGAVYSNTGGTGSHLHFGLAKGGNTTDFKNQTHTTINVCEKLPNCPQMAEEKCTELTECTDNTSF